ncbi:hypothetical protein [Nocardia suismassiliense]|uniref:hypothetical protein n=1 Tax=Nocardia suismassiliense TaxID=2077092 RepID=UPI000D1E8C05|nr:hypothetical protein [Nocardia suismassiliense]
MLTLWNREYPLWQAPAHAWARRSLRHRLDLGERRPVCGVAQVMPQGRRCVVQLPTHPATGGAPLEIEVPRCARMTITEDAYAGQRLRITTWWGRTLIHAPTTGIEVHKG